MSSARFGPGPALSGTLRPPPDKSISHRAAMLAAMGEGETRDRVAILDAADTRSTLAAVAALGAGVEELGPPRDAGRTRPEDHGRRPARAGGDRGGGYAIDVGNAGTLLRLLPGWLAGQEGGSWTLDGDESIRRRPVDRVAEPLRAMGAGVGCRDDRLPRSRSRARRFTARVTGCRLPAPR